MAVYMERRDNGSGVYREEGQWWRCIWKGGTMVAVYIKRRDNGSGVYGKEGQW